MAILDNCPAHPYIQDLVNIRLVFLPPNTTPLSQPIDAGIIRAVKHHYRKVPAIRQLVAMETGATSTLDLFQSM